MRDGECKCLTAGKFGGKTWNCYCRSGGALTVMGPQITKVKYKISNAALSPFPTNGGSTRLLIEGKWFGGIKSMVRRRLF